MTKIKDFDGPKYTFEDLLAFVQAAEKDEICLRDLMGSDLATLPTIITDLIGLIQKTRETIIEHRQEMLDTPGMRSGVVAMDALVDLIDNWGENKND